MSSINHNTVHESGDGMRAGRNGKLYHQNSMSTLGDESESDAGSLPLSRQNSHSATRLEAADPTIPPDSLDAGTLPAIPLTRSASDIQATQTQALTQGFAGIVDGMSKNMGLLIKSELLTDAGALKPAEELSAKGELLSGFMSETFDTNKTLKLGENGPEVNFYQATQIANDNSNGDQAVAKTALTTTGDKGFLKEVTPENIKPKAEKLLKLADGIKSSLEEKLRDPNLSQEEKASIKADIKTINEIEQKIQNLLTQIDKINEESPTDDKKDIKDLDAQAAKLRADHAKKMTDLFLQIINETIGLLISAATAASRNAAKAHQAIGAGVS